MKVLTVVGARPQFIKAAPVRRALDKAGHRETLVHTGQHYDSEMSAAHFRDLELPAPDVNLGVGSGPHGEQTAQMLAGLERIMTGDRPDWVLVYGDTNSTLAGALAAVKLRIPLAHVEAGQRSFDRSMPEEINRVLADHASDLLLCSTPTAVANLQSENIRTNVHLVGDVMIDALDWIVRDSTGGSGIRETLGLSAGSYLLVTVHRAENTDNVDRLLAILAALDAVDEPVVFPVHPRTRRVLATLGWQPRPHLRLLAPLGYRDMVALEQGARMILTDSGGIQKEAYFLGIPSVILRERTEWPEIVAAGWATLAGTDCAAIVAAVRSLRPPAARPPLHGDGAAAVRCVTHLEETRVR
jgi:UDP-N-acetylglucosamine 2-epimerase